MIDLESIKAEWEEGKELVGWYAYFDRENIPALIAEVERLSQALKDIETETWERWEDPGTLIYTVRSMAQDALKG